MDLCGVKICVLCVDSFFICICVMSGVVWHPKKEKHSKNHKITFQDIISLSVLDYAFIAGVHSFMNGIIATFLVLYAQGKGIRNVSIYFTVSAVFFISCKTFSRKDC